MCSCRDVLGAIAMRVTGQTRPGVRSCTCIETRSCNLVSEQCSRLSSSGPLAQTGASGPRSHRGFGHHRYARPLHTNTQTHTYKYIRTRTHTHTHTHMPTHRGAARTAARGTLGLRGTSGSPPCRSTTTSSRSRSSRAMPRARCVQTCVRLVRMRARVFS